MGNHTDGAVPLAAVDREVVVAYTKISDGLPLNRYDRAAIKRYEKKLEESLRWKYYQSIPQKHWRAMAGKQVNQVVEQATRYGLPFGDVVVDLPKVVAAFHAFLAKNAYKLAATEDGGSSPALEEFRRERAIMARLDRQQREGQLLPRDQVREGMLRIAATIRAAGEILARQYGNEAREIIVEAITDAESEIGRLFGKSE